MRAMGKVPRHEFVPIELQLYAYANRPLPIGALDALGTSTGAMLRPSTINILL